MEEKTVDTLLDKKKEICHLNGRNSMASFGITIYCFYFFSILFNSDCTL